MYLGPPIELPYDKFLTMEVFLGYPSAVGHVHVTSGEDIRSTLIQASSKRAGLLVITRPLSLELQLMLYVTGTMTSHSLFGVTSVQGSLLAV